MAWDMSPERLLKLKPRLGSSSASQSCVCLNCVKTRHLAEASAALTASTLRCESAELWANLASLSCSTKNCCGPPSPTVLGAPCTALWGRELKASVTPARCEAQLPLHGQHELREHA